MKKLLYLLYHCSTGGMPQYTLKQIETFKDRFDISVIELNDYGTYEVQRNKIKKICNFYQLYGKQEELLPLIKKLDPQIIHIQECPENFLNSNVIAKLYSNNRNYNIVVTSHSSLTRAKDFTYIPDRIVAVNKWQMDLFCREFAGVEDVSIGMWEYPIEDRKVWWEEKQAAKIRLRMDNNIQVLMPGLFTKGKNQGEIFKIAPYFPNITFNFVGNQAGNFADYWEPLMKNKPENCVVWGERNDMEEFYLASDFVYFSSIYELWPLVIREALSYKLPIFLRKLPTYSSEYDDNRLIHYIDNDLENTKITIDAYLKKSNFV